MPRRLASLRDKLFTDIQQSAVFHTRGTGGFTGATRQATIQVLRALVIDLILFQEVFDQVDAPSRSVQFITQQLIGRAGRRTETAVHALAQDRIRLLDQRKINQARMDFCFHLLTFVLAFSLTLSHTFVESTRIEDAFWIKHLLQVPVEL